MTTEKKTPFNGRCGGCGHVWTIAYIPMELTKFSTITKAAKCPMCATGSKNIYFDAEGSQQP